MSNPLTLDRAQEARRLRLGVTSRVTPAPTPLTQTWPPADFLPGCPLLNRDWEIVEIPGVCPCCRGDGLHKSRSKSPCGVCSGTGKAYERRALTEIGKAVCG